MPKPARSQVPADMAKKIALLPPRPSMAPRMVDASEIVARQAANAAVCAKLFSPKARKKA